MIEFAIRNTYTKFCDILEEQGFNKYQIKDITEAVISCMSEKWTKTHEIMRETYKNRYGDE